MINLRKVAFKVLMKSGRMTRHKWVKNRVHKGDLVKDEDGRLFRVKGVQMVPDPSMRLTVLERITNDPRITKLVKKANLQNAHDIRIRYEGD